MADVFISYAKPDDKIAQQLAQKLRQRNCSVFMDQSLVTGENLTEQLEDKIKQASTVIILLSKSTQRNKWVEEELAQAIAHGKSVIPILLDSSATENWIWPLVADREAIELNRDASATDVINKINTAARSNVGPPRPVGSLEELQELGAGDTVERSRRSKVDVARSDSSEQVNEDTMVELLGHASPWVDLVATLVQIEVVVSNSGAPISVTIADVETGEVKVIQGGEARDFDTSQSDH